MNINQKGITLIALIVTIVVIIILAAIVITTGLQTPTKAGYAKFTNEISAIEQAVKVKFAKVYGEKAVDGDKPSKETVYKEILKEGGKTQQIEGMTLNEIDEEKLGKELPIYKDIKGIESKWYVHIETDKVYLIPGFEYDGKVYITNDQGE